MSQAPLVEVAVTRRVRVLGSLEDMAVCAMAMSVGVGLGLAVTTMTTTTTTNDQRPTPNGRRSAVGCRRSAAAAAAAQRVDGGAAAGGGGGLWLVGRGGACGFYLFC